MDLIRAAYSVPPLVLVSGARSFRRFAHSYWFTPDEHTDDSALFLEECRPILVRMLTDLTSSDNAVLLWCSLVVNMEKGDGSEITPRFNPLHQYVFREQDIDSEIVATFAQLMKREEDFQERGSGWTVQSVERLEVHMSPYVPLRGGCYKPLPAELVRKKAITNIKSDGNECFRWAVIAHLKPATEHPSRLYHYRPHAALLDFTGLSFPIAIKDIPRFEALNNISVNIYGWANNLLYPKYLSQTPRDRHAHLVHYDGHYSTVKSLDRLLGDQNKHAKKEALLRPVPLPQYSAERLTDHLTRCKTANPVQTVMPKDPLVHFKNYRRQQRVSLVIYADFEALVVPMAHAAAQDPAHSSSTTKTHQHLVCGFGLYPVLSCCPQHPGGTVPTEPTVYRGPHCARRFLDTVLDLAEEHQERINDPAPMHCSPADLTHHAATSTCHICKKDIPLGEQKDRDHCHICGRYRGPAHAVCNRDYRCVRDVSVVFHNSRYSTSNSVCVWG